MPRQLIAALLLVAPVLTTLALPLPPLASQAGEPAPAHDPALFRAVIEAIPARWAWGRLGVYPRPIESADELPYPAIDLPFALDSTEISAREQMLLIEMATPLALNMNLGDCAGVLIARESTAECPAAGFTKVAVGLPRVVDNGVVPSWKGAGRQAGRRADVVVRVLSVSSSPNGSGVSSADYYAVQDSYGWEVVAKRVLVIFD